MFFELNNIVMVGTSQFQLFETKQSIPENLRCFNSEATASFKEQTRGLRELFTTERHILEHQ